MENYLFLSAEYLLIWVKKTTLSLLKQGALSAVGQTYVQLIYWELLVHFAEVFLFFQGVEQNLLGTDRYETLNNAWKSKLLLKGSQSRQDTTH